MTNLLRTLLSFIPRRLPTGMTSFNKWVSDVVFISDLPDNASTRHLAATFIMHTPPKVVFLSIRHIASQLSKAAAYQVAQEVIKDSKKEDSMNGQPEPKEAPTQVVS